MSPSSYLLSVTWFPGSFFEYEQELDPLGIFTTLMIYISLKRCHVAVDRFPHSH
jgi:hypothetical protein